MNGNKRYIGFAIFLVVALCAMVWAYGFVTNRQQSPDGVSIGVVRIDDVLEFNPSYEDYKQAKNELDLLQRQYELEQQALKCQVRDTRGTVEISCIRFNLVRCSYGGIANSYCNKRK